MDEVQKICTLLVQTGGDIVRHRVPGTSHGAVHKLALQARERNRVVNTKSTSLQLRYMCFMHHTQIIINNWGDVIIEVCHREAQW